MPCLNYAPRTPEWLRLGFVVPWHAETTPAPSGPKVWKHGCEAQRSGLPCHHHPEPECTHDEEPSPSPNQYNRLRYALFGREIDCARNRWEYYAFDATNDVRIPVGVPKNRWQLQNGDVVQLLGDTGRWAVVLTEIY